MRVLLINHEYTTSGASLLMLRLALYLKGRGHRCDAMAMFSQEGALGAAYREHGIPHLTTAQFADYDVVLCNTIFAGSVVSRAAKHVRTVWWIHEVENGLNHLLGNPSDVAAFRGAAAVVFQTAFQRDSVFRSFLYAEPAAKLFVIPNGVEIAAAGPSVAKTRPLRIVSIGSIDFRKRHGDLIRAVAALGRDDVECVIIGKYGQLDEADRKLVAASPGAFTLPGELSNDQTLAWLRSADLFCLPSWVESQPLSILEAALLGKPLVLTDLPAYAGIWRHDENCLLAPVGEVGKLSQSIAALLRDQARRERLGQAARRTAQGFGTAAFFARFDAMLESVTQSPGGGARSLDDAGDAPVN